MNREEIYNKYNEAADVLAAEQKRFQDVAQQFFGKVYTVEVDYPTNHSLTIEVSSNEQKLLTVDCCAYGAFKVGFPYIRPFDPIDNEGRDMMMHMQKLMDLDGWVEFRADTLTHLKRNEKMDKELVKWSERVDAAEDEQ